MTKDYRRLWKDVTTTIGEAKAVRTLVEILADKEGRAFISRLERNDAELCIEVLDHVSRNLYLPLLLPTDLVRASQSTTSKPLRSRSSLSH